MKQALFTLSILSILGACDNTVGENLTSTNTTSTSTATTMGSSIALTIAGPQTAVAGTAFDLDLSVVDQDGAGITDGLAYTVTLANASGATIDGTTLTLTESGVNTVTVAASWGNYVDEASAIIEVNAGAATSLTFALDDDSVVAGSSIGFVATLTDTYGNTLEDGPTVYSLPLSGIVIGTDTILGEIADTYTIYATDGTLEAEAPLTVTAGPAVSLDLTLSDMTPPLFGTTTAIVDGLDSYGNDITDFTLETSPATTTIKGSSITFNAEGTYSVTATSNGISDTESPVLVDSNGPLITVTTPARGEYFPTGAVSVSGNASDSGTSVDSVSVNGTSVTVNADGSFVGTITPTLGANLLTIVATDTAGNTADYISGFMSGDYVPDGNDVASAIELRLDESGIGFLAEDALASFDISTLEAQLLAMNPLYYSYSSTDWYCWYNEIIDFAFTGLSYGDLDIILDAKTGFLRVGITISNLQLDFDGYIEECYVSDEFSAVISSSLVTVTVDNYFSVDADGNISVTGNNPVITLDNYDLTLQDSWLGDLASLFGYDLEGMIYDEIVGQLTSLIVDEVPPTIADALSGIAIDTEFDMVGASVGLTGKVSNIDIDEDGLTVLMAADADGGFVVADIPSNPGSVLFYGPSPTYSVGTEMGLGMSLDLLNQVLHESWQVGALSIDILNDEIGIDASLIGLIFEGATTLDIEAYPMLPPVLTATGGAPPLLLDINEMQLDMYGMVDGTYTFLGTVSANINTDLEVNLDSGMLLLTLGTTTAVADNINPTAETVSAHEALETTLEALLPSLLPSVIEDFALELPEVAGITMTLNSVDTQGEWIVIEGEID